MKLCAIAAVGRDHIAVGAAVPLEDVATARCSDRSEIAYLAAPGIEDPDVDIVAAPKPEEDRRLAARAATLGREAVLRIDLRRVDGALRELQPLGDRECR